MTKVKRTNGGMEFQLEREPKHVPWVDILAGATQGRGANSRKMMRHGARVGSGVPRARETFDA